MDVTRVKLKYVLPAMVLILVAGAAVMALWPGSQQQAALSVRGAEGDHYFCDQCRKEFVMNRDDWSKIVMDQEILTKDPMAGRRPHCPLCQAKHSGWMMISCPKCGKHYLPAGMGPGPARGQPDVCPDPSCKTDRSEWYRSNQAR